MRKKSAKEIAKERDEDMFMAEYALNGGNATKAAMALWPDLEYSSARKKGHLLANNEEARQRFRKRINKQSEREIMTVKERQEVLSDIARGDIKASIKERISAIKVLNNMDAIGAPTMNVNITVEQKRQMAQARIDELLGIEMGEKDGVITIECSEPDSAADSGLDEVCDSAQDIEEVDQGVHS